MIGTEFMGHGQTQEAGLQRPSSSLPPVIPRSSVASQDIAVPASVEGAIAPATTGSPSVVALVSLVRCLSKVAPLVLYFLNL
ncbi:hypothetical protein KPB2_5351 [Klebsiella pneumoniae Kb677]|nr:hypothetical protein KPB2_5351 [Klebsiella pneumoniae Kb677]